MSREGSKLLIDGGETGELIRQHDWASTPIGPLEAWPQPLRCALEIMLNSPESMFLAWGGELTFFYNDAYRTSIGPERHPGSLSVVR